jgi:hypothetical protein
MAVPPSITEAFDVGGLETMPADINRDFRYNLSV